MGFQWKGKFAKSRRTRRIPYTMNRTEAAYAAILDQEVQEGKILGWLYESLRFRLADNTHLTPDFLVFEVDDTLSIHEVKGGLIRDDAWVKAKVAAEQYPWIRWKLAQFKKRQWTVKDIGHYDDQASED